jgi:hypothetical protein
MNYPWDTAPEWARYAAMDSDGSHWWYENQPSYKDGFWAARGMFEPICPGTFSPETSVQERPAPINPLEIFT